MAASQRAEARVTGRFIRHHISRPDQLSLASTVDYATTRNRKGETIAECAERFVQQHGLFAAERALHWHAFFSDNDLVLAVFYKMVYHIITVGIKPTTLLTSFPTWDERKP